MKTLVIGLNWLGDILMSFPALHLEQSAESPSLTVLSRPHLAATYLLHPAPLEIVSLDTSSSWWSQLPVIRRLRQAAFDRIVVFPRSLRTALLAWCCGGKHRIGYASEWRSPFLHRALPLPDDLNTRHESTWYQSLMRESDHRLRADPILPRLLPASEQVSLLQRLGLSDRSYLVLAPGAAFGPAKRWPSRHFQTIARRWIAEYHTPVVLTGSAGEAELTAAVKQGLEGPIIDLAGKTSLPELAVLIYRATALIANDSGTMHLGALTRTPMIVPIGPTNPERTGPLSDRAVLVRARRDHEPCRQRVCPRSGPSCLEQLAPDEIWAALIEALKIS